MAYEPKDNTASLFRNKNKTPGDNRPDYTGNGMVNGNKVDLSAWMKKSKSGQPFLSIAIKPPYQGSAGGQPGEAQRAQPDDEEVPDFL